MLLSALLRLFAYQSSRTWLPILVCSVLVALLASEKAPAWLVASWMVFQLVALVSVPLGLRFWPEGRCEDKTRLRVVIATRGLRGLADAASVMLFPYMSDHGRLLQTMIYAGLATGAIGSSAGYLPVYGSYAIPVMLTLALGWLATPTPEAQGDLSMWTAGIVCMFLLALLALARDHFRIFKASALASAEHIRLNHRLRAALEQAETANTAKTRFLASASHDLRQPLHSLSLFFATLRLQIESTENQRLINHIDQALSALQSQMNTLLDMSKLDAGMVNLNWQGILLSPLLMQLQAAYQPVADQKGIRLILDCPPDLAIHSDPEQFGRVVRNLLDNAIKYTSHGHVHLLARLQEKRVLVRLKDTGCGIAPIHHQQVFEEFFQVDNPERDRERGLGLGLSIVRRLSTLLGLEMELHSEPGVGTTIFLYLPQANHLAAIGKPCPDAHDIPPPMPMCHVLVLDDEAEVRAGMRALLERMGCEVSLASCTEEALAHAAARTPDLVLADLRLRGQESGIGAVLQLRQRHAGLPAIIITGDTAPNRLRQALAAGLPVLHKPVAAESLMQAIARSLENPP